MFYSLCLAPALKPITSEGYGASPCALGCNHKVIAMDVVETGLVGFIFVTVVSQKKWMEITSEPTTGQNES